jgi:hypothetical protein
MFPDFGPAVNARLRSDYGRDQQRRVRSLGLREALPSAAQAPQIFPSSQIMYGLCWASNGLPA